MVSGHIDGVSRVVSVEQEARSVRLGFDIPESLTRYIARKGSVSIDGTSLTVNEVSGTNMFVNIVPHTLEQTIMSGYSAWYQREHRGRSDRPVPGTTDSELSLPC